MKKNKKSGFRETIETIVYASLIAILVRTFAYEPFNIPSGSMLPTLFVGDYLFVSKFSYGYSRHSFPFSFLPFSGRLLGSQPERGDIAVFKLPRDNETDYIKRIIGLPGDKIQVRNGVVYINGEAVSRRRIADFVAPDQHGNVVTMAQYLETLSNGRSYAVAEMTEFGGLDNTPVYKVPAGHYFMMGDNRDNSLDSRIMSMVGFVPAVNLVSRAEVLYFSQNGTASWWQIWRWPQAIRFGRIGKEID
ncbi:MAG: signal peptidase I [Alphaproteobacteria bacterium]|nr:signal peptidase I [Alphaproteobacteria bacterium]